MVLILTMINTFHDLHIQLYTSRRVHLKHHGKTGSTLEHNDQRALWSRTIETVVWLSTSYQTTRAAPHALFMADCDLQMEGIVPLLKCQILRC